jgi:hypothetical protein
VGTIVVLAAWSLLRLEAMWLWPKRRRKRRPLALPRFKMSRETSRTGGMRWIQADRKTEQAFDSIKGTLKHEEEEENQAE